MGNGRIRKWGAGILAAIGIGVAASQMDNDSSNVAGDNNQTPQVEQQDTSVNSILNKDQNLNVSFRAYESEVMKGVQANKDTISNLEQNLKYHLSLALDSEKITPQEHKIISDLIKDFEGRVMRYLYPNG